MASRCLLKLNPPFRLRAGKLIHTVPSTLTRRGVPLSSTPRPTARQYSHSTPYAPTVVPPGGDSPAPVPSDAQRRTIYAVATPPGKGGVAVVRVSGPDALAVYARVVRPLRAQGRARPLEAGAPEPRRMVRCAVVDPLTGEELDDGLAVFFRGPRSFTTEDVLELHVHSGRAILASVLGALSRLSQPARAGAGADADAGRLLLRAAERGEFTRRAFLGGRLDLTQAEALGDLVDAETETQRRVALRAARGSTRERVEKIRGEIVKAMAMTEAVIDFGEGEDLEEGVYDHARQLVRQLHATIEGHLADSRRGEILRSGLRLAIFGPPNAGKSSLLNFFAGREAAIVTPVPGTTRDVVELTLDIGGLAVVVADTAGLRKTDDLVERIGVHRAQQRVTDSDVSLCVLSLPDMVDGLPDQVRELITPSTFVLLNKSDLCEPEARPRAESVLSSCAGSWTISLTSGVGLERFLSEFGKAIHKTFASGHGREEPLVTNARHRTHLEAAQSFLQAFLSSDDVVVGAEELRYAANAVGKVTGAIDVEEVLDVVFRHEFRNCPTFGLDCNAPVPHRLLTRRRRPRRPPYVSIRRQERTNDEQRATTTMPKPTLFQHILNRPSQSYAAPPPGPPRRSLDSSRFHSVKHDMLKAAAEGAGGATAGSSPSPHHRGLLPTPSTLSPTPAPASAHHPSATPPSVSTAPADAADNAEGSASSGDEFFTPDVSPRESLYEEAEKQPSVGASHVPDAGARISDPISPPVHTGADAAADTDARVTGSEPDSQIPPLRPQPHSHSRAPSSASASSTSSLASTSTAAGSYIHSERSWPTSHSAPSTRASTPVESERSSSRSSSLRRKQQQQQSRQATYTDDDWAKDVRWLVPASESRSTSSTSSRSRSSRRSRASQPQPQHPKPAMLQTLPPAPIPDRMRSAPHRRSNSTSFQPARRRSMGRRRMSAVWEEDEGDELAPGSPPRRVQTEPGGLSELTRLRSLSSPHGKPPRARPPSLLSGGSGVSASTGHSVYTRSSQTVDLPVPLPVSDGGTPSGFTSLVLPRAAYTPSSHKRFSLRFGSDSQLDITRSGLSQTTMSTISITKNAATTTFSNRSSRFLSLSSFTISTPGSETNIKVSASTPAHLLTTLPSPLSFTSHTAPPSKVSSQQVMVQVYAVGVDGLDDLIVSEKVARKDCYGFVPGRSFVGRAVDCGFEVNSVAKSDWVMGLLDCSKGTFCGGLSEFIVVDKRRLTRCPRPSPALTLEQIALLPLCGIPAHRAVRTSQNVQTGARALVLQGQDGAGALAVQELAAAGVHVTVQISSGEPADSETEKHAESTWHVEDRVRKWGAAEVRVGSPLGAVDALEDSAFDFVVDAAGGRRVWDACRRVLSSAGQFTTLAGESARAVPSVHAHFRANLRSLRRAFVKQDRKALGYAWVSPAADVDYDGEDVRDSLVAVGRLAADGVLKPWVDPARCVPFERAPMLFTRGNKVVLREGRTGVVRLLD
ncbi:hypothetical protein DFH11DRAFT_1510406 [Phellopilus nigrolimitatus]|nr:hypothetical protein DFH11DRAFT_1510406 [Phellopilus nigrolimitatus]